MRKQYWGLVTLAAMIVIIAAISPALAKPLGEATVERIAPDRLALFWKGKDPVDVYVAESADAAISSAKLVSRDDKDGYSEIDTPIIGRRYVLLHDVKAARITRIAERLVPLEHGSNFRDIGGYEAAEGKHVRWGHIFRSGATPLLSDNDLAQINQLGLRHLVDLRSSEERALAPSRISGIPYSAVGYSFNAIVKAGSSANNGLGTYRALPAMLAPQLRIIFAELLAGEAPLVYNCSAGQDRTGFVTAMILSALGVSRESILADYHLSTQYRQPEFEMPEIDISAHPDDPAAAMFARFQHVPDRKPLPLIDAAGRPFLDGAYAEIETKWGSVDGYLEKEIGLTPAKRAQLKLLYLE
jgi:protein-tyrosine phosphatase